MNKPPQELIKQTLSGNYLYVIGGQSESLNKSVLRLRLDEKFSNWTKVANVPTARAFFQTVVVPDCDLGLSDEP